MNIIAIWLILVRTKLALIVMCIYPHGSRVFWFFQCVHVNSTFLGCDSLPWVLLRWIIILPYIANRSRKSFAVFADRMIPWNFSSEIACAIGLTMQDYHSTVNFSSELKFSSATAKLFYLEWFAIYMMAQILAGTGVPGIWFVDCDEHISLSPTRMNSLESWMALSKHLHGRYIQIILIWPPHFQFASYGPVIRLIYNLRVILQGFFTKFQSYTVAR